MSYLLVIEELSTRVASTHDQELRLTQQLGAVRGYRQACVEIKEMLEQMQDVQDAEIGDEDDDSA